MRKYFGIFFLKDGERIEKVSYESSPVPEPRANRKSILRKLSRPGAPEPTYFRRLANSPVPEPRANRKRRIQSSPVPEAEV